MRSWPIDQCLAAALRGELPFGPQIAGIGQLLEQLLTPGVPLGTPATPA